MKHVSYISSALVYSLVLIIFGAGLWWVWNAVPIFFPIMGAWLLCCGTAYITFMFISKGRAQWKLDYEGKDSKPQRRVRSGTKD